MKTYQGFRLANGSVKVVRIVPEMRAPDAPEFPANQNLPIATPHLLAADAAAGRAACEAALEAGHFRVCGMQPDVFAALSPSVRRKLVAPSFYGLLELG